MIHVDILTSVRNGESYILEAIQSVQKQTFSDWTYFIVDDGSTDNTKSIVEKQALNDHRIHFSSQAANGASSALNKVMKLGSGKFISFIDADDLWHPSKLKKQIEVFEKDAALNFCFTMVEEFDESKNLEFHSYRARKEALRGYIRSSLLFKRKMIESVGYFDEEIAMGDFIDWLSEPIHRKENLFVLEDVLTYRRVHGNNMTAFGDKQGYLKILKKHLDRKKEL